jgi:hypothetical protein
LAAFLYEVSEPPAYDELPLNKICSVVSKELKCATRTMPAEF